MELVRTFVVNYWELKIAFNEPAKGGAPSKSEASVNAPGAGNYKIDVLQLKTDRIAPGEALTLSLQISGENIAFLYTEVYHKDKSLPYYYGPLTHDVVRSTVEKEVNGLVHPVWDPEIKLTLEVAPVIRVLTDGLSAAFAFMHPLGYGVEGYQLEGLFTKKGSGNSNKARFKFDSTGEMTDKRVIQEKRGRLVSHDLVIKPGDMFIPGVHVLTDMNIGNPKSHSLHGISGTLTKLDESFHWVDEAALVGDYLLGVVVEDFNGDQYHHYVPFTIEGE